MDDSFSPEEVLDFWFPDDGHWSDPDRHRDFWQTRMRGGMDEIICRDFGPLTEAAARGRLDHWAETPRGRLALLIALDQFPRSYWRDRPECYGQDIKACRLVMEGLENGHYEALPHVWERQFHIIAMTHCEGPDHLRRMDLAVDLSKAHREIAPPGFEPFIERAVAQAERVRGIIAAYGRHPHRNAILGRVTTDSERPYLEKGEFPHETEIEVNTDAGTGA